LRALFWREYVRHYFKMTDVKGSNAENTMKAVVVHKYGGVEALKVEDKWPIPVLGPRDVLVAVAVSGVNYIDTYHRQGTYEVKLPFVIGREASGIVKSVGSDVKEVKVGDRVVFVGDKTYAEYVAIHESKVVLVPEWLTLQQAAAILLQGLTAHYLVNDTYVVKPNDNVIVHAGAGGVGQLLIQLVKQKGANVLTTVSSAEKAQLVKRLGADEAFIYTQPNFDLVAEVKRVTNGAMCQVVYDGVGKDTWKPSLHSLAPLGHLVIFGNSSGKVPPIDPMDLMNAGSITLTRPMLGSYTATPAILRKRSSDLFDLMKRGLLSIQISETFPLQESSKAHQHIESRKATGKILVSVNDKLV